MFAVSINFGEESFMLVVRNLSLREQEFVGGFGLMTERSNLNYVSLWETSMPTVGLTRSCRVGGVFSGVKILG
jgi:hypothetical protein